MTKGPSALAYAVIGAGAAALGALVVAGKYFGVVTGEWISATGVHTPDGTYKPGDAKQYAVTVPSWIKPQDLQAWIIDAMGTNATALRTWDPATGSTYIIQGGAAVAGDIHQVYAIVRGKVLGIPITLRTRTSTITVSN